MSTHDDHHAKPWETVRRGLLMLVSSPAGAGKTSLSRRLVADFAGMTLSISATTRRPRPGEEEGREYFFKARDEFEAMIAAGELAGKLEESLGQVVVQMRKTHELTSSIRGAMIYPAVILTAMGAVAVMMVTVVLPKLITLFDEFDASLPLATRILIALTNFFSNPVNLVNKAVNLPVCLLNLFLQFFDKRLQRNIEFYFPIPASYRHRLLLHFLITDSHNIIYFFSLRIMHFLANSFSSII